MKPAFYLLPLIPLVLTNHAARAQTTPLPARFSGDLLQIKPLADGTVAILTTRAIYFADDKSLTHWTAKTLGPSPPALSRIVGGNPNMLFLLAPAPTSATMLFTWSPRQKLQPLNATADNGQGKITRRPVSAFVDAQRGGYAIGASIVMTLDGGITWIQPAPLFPASDLVDDLKWVTPDTLLTGSALGTITRFKVSPKGELNSQWTANRGRSRFDYADERVWLLAGKKLTVLNALTGETVATAETPRVSNTIHAFGSEAWLLDDNQMSKWKLLDATLTTTATEKDLQLEIAAVISGDLYSLDANTLRKWDTAAHMFQPIKCTINNHELTEPATNPAATPETATPEELREMAQLAAKVSPEAQDRILTPIMKIPNLTPRDRVHRVIDAYKSAIANEPTAKP